jgi:hypothetical protein
MRLLLVTVGLAVAGACAEPDPNYGDPSGIVGKTLPKESAGSAAGGSDAFGGAYSADANKPTTTLKASHQAKGGPTPETVGNCLDCHKTGGAAAAKLFAIGGRIAKNTANVDVVVSSGGDKIGPVKSDADGFFWAPGTLKAGSNAAVRNANGDSKMTQPLLATDGGCDQTGTCHGGSLGLPGGSLK